VTKPFQVAGLFYGEDCIRAFPYNDDGIEIGKADITAFGIEILEEPTLLFDECCLVGDLVFRLHPDPSDEGFPDFTYPGWVEVRDSADTPVIRYENVRVGDEDCYSVDLTGMSFSGYSVFWQLGQEGDDRWTSEGDDFPWISLDLDCDINNDGHIASDDEGGEEIGIGEIVRVDDEDDSPGGEDDLQYMRVAVDSSHDQGVVWFTYDNTKVKIWKDLAQTQPVASGSEASPTWDLTSGDTVPDRVYVEGLATTEEGSSIDVALHWKKGSAELSDRIITTVTDDVGHYAYLRGAYDYLVENDYELFCDVVDAPGGVAEDFRLVAVRAEKARLFVHDAVAPHPDHEGIDDVVADRPAARIIVNGTFFEMWTPQNVSVGRLINDYALLPISADVTAGDAPEVKGWFGQQKDGDLSGNAPNSEPTVPTSPYTDNDIRAAAGGLAALYPTYDGKSISDIVDAIGDEHGSWNNNPTAHMGIDGDENVLFVVTALDADQGSLDPDVVLHELIQDIVDSGAVRVVGLDGGSSVALAHRDRQGNNLAVATKGAKHAALYGGRRVNNYIVINLVP